jgi:MFS family permease
MFFKLLRNKNFMNLWITQTFTQLEVTVVDFTVLLVFAQAVNANQFGESATAIVFALQFIPALPSALIAGVIADIVDRRILILSLNLFRAGFLAIFVFATHPGAHLYLFVFVMAICMHMYEVIEKTSLRNVVSEDQLGTANGLFLVTMNTTTLLGVIGAGLLEPTVGLAGILIFGTVLFIGASILSYRLPKNLNNFFYDHYVDDEDIIKDTTKAIKRLFKSVKISIEYLVTIPPVWMAVILAIIVQTVVLIIASVSFTYGKEVLQINESQVSFFLLIPVAAGLAIGGALTPILVKKYNYRKVVMFAWFTASILLIIFGGIGFVTNNLRPGITLQYTFFTILTIFIGVFVTLIQAPALELIQTFADAKIRGRVFGILVGATNTVAGFLVALSGLLVDVISSKAFIVVAGITLLILTFLYRILIDKTLHGKDFTEYTINESPVLSQQTLTA